MDPGQQQQQLLPTARVCACCVGRARHTQFLPLKTEKDGGQRVPKGMTTRRHKRTSSLLGGPAVGTCIGTPPPPPPFIPLPVLFILLLLFSCLCTVKKFVVFPVLLLLFIFLLFLLCCFFLFSFFLLIVSSSCCVSFLLRWNS